MGVGIVGVERQGAVEQKLRLGIAGRGRAVVQDLAGEHALVGHHVGGGLAVGALVGGGLDAAGQRGRDRGGDLVLDGEDVGAAVEALGPDVAVGQGVDQLDGDAHPVARLAHAALDHVLDAELLRSTAGTRTGLPLWTKARVARDHEQIAKASDSSVMMSSVRPSAKNSCSGSPLMLAKGSTAIEGLAAAVLAVEAGVGAVAGALPSSTMA